MILQKLFNNAVDATAVSAVVANVAGIITGVAATITAVLTMLWAIARLYEMPSVQRMLPEKWRMKP